MNRKLYVGNLPFQTTDQELEALFAQAGPVESVRVMRDMATGRPRGFAFVEMGTDAAAEAAVSQFNQKEFGGRTIAVSEARPQAPRSGGFGGGGGGRREGGRREGGGRRSEPRW
ncbi:MAG: RNA recognition motif domain-containing protein [Acidobacteriota bacterium]